MQRASLLERGGDVEDHELVDPFVVVSRSELSGIAGVAETGEVHAFDDLAVANVEARDDPLRQHLIHSRGPRRQESWKAHADLRGRTSPDGIARRRRAHAPPSPRTPLHVWSPP